MTRQLKKSDWIEVARYLDGEMDLQQRRAFEQRVAESASLRGAVDEAKQQKGWFGESTQEQAVRAPRGLADAVMAQVSALPARQDLARLADAEDVATGVAKIGWRLLAAAALLCGMALIIGVSVARPPEDHSLQAIEEGVRKIDSRALDAMKKRRSLPADGPGAGR